MPTLIRDNRTTVAMNTATSEAYTLVSRRLGWPVRVTMERQCSLER